MNWSACLAQLIECTTLAFGVVNSSPALDVELT